LDTAKVARIARKLIEMVVKYEPTTTYYKVGTMRIQYPGSPVYLAITTGLPGSHVFKGIGTEKDIAYDAEIVSLFIKTQDNKFVLTKDYDNNSVLCGGSYCDQNMVPRINESIGIIYNANLSLDKFGSGHRDMKELNIHIQNLAQG